MEKNNVFADLHIHTIFSDGDLHPKTAHYSLRTHADYVTITDHNTAEYHLYVKDNNICCFTGVELSSYIKVKNDECFLTECLLYGFTLDEIDFVKKYREKIKRTRPSFRNRFMPGLQLKELARHFEEVREKGTAKLFLAHPYYTGLYKEEKIIKYLDKVKPYVDGVECLHPSCLNEKHSVVLLEWCKKNNKLSSVGSDTHSKKLRNPPFLHLIEEYKELFMWIPEMAEKFK